jgi:hypothetical protein
MNPEDPVRDVMRRTMENLRFIEQHATSSGPFEVTQLVNSFLGALAHPWEHLRSDLDSLSLAQAEHDGWPHITKERVTDEEPESLGDLLRLVRHALAHGNIEFLPGARNEIRALRIWNNHPRRGVRTWGALVTVETMRVFLDRFVDLAEELHVKRQQSELRTA